MGLALILILTALFVASLPIWERTKWWGPAPAFCVGVLLFIAIAVELILHGRTNL